MRWVLVAGITLLAAGCRQTQDLGGSRGQPCSGDSGPCSPGDGGGGGAGGTAAGPGGSGGTGGSGGEAPPKCGDNKIDPGETCDDGNTLDGDACPSVCFHAVSDVVSGHVSSCAILVDGRMKCWGKNGDGTLGVGDTQNRGDNPGEMGDNLPAVDLGAGQSAASISVGGYHVCAILKGAPAQVKCWGGNFSGELGLGDTDPRGDDPGEMGDNLPVVDLGAGQTPVAIAAGALRSCVVLSGGTVKCWGKNDFGQLGLGDTDARGDNPGEMGDNLPPVDLGAGKVAVAVAVGSNHTCALLSDKTVKCWGWNVSGQLGLGDTDTRGDNPGEMGDNLPVVPLGGDAMAIGAGGGFTCALLADGSVKCWGRNSSGELGLGDTQNRGDAPGWMDNLPKVDFGQGKIATALAVGLEFSCALLSDGSAKCWGVNGSGDLGIGSTLTHGDQPGEMGDNLPAVDFGAGLAPSSISAGLNHACARLMDGHVKCWGSGLDGMLGYGNELSKGADVFEMGDNLPFVEF